MNWSSEFAERMEPDVLLAPLTWYRLGGPATWVFHPRDSEDLSRFIKMAHNANVPIKVLGGGANVLIRDDGFDGVVVRLDAPYFREVDWAKQYVRAGAGVDLMPFSRECSRRGLSGLECLAGIPGSVGGAMRMNAGGRSGEFGDVVYEVDVLLEDGCVQTWPRERLGFRYRGSNINREIVISTRLRLAVDNPTAVMRRYEEYFSLKQRTQPLVDRSAGCVFKNPSDASAGALIDSAGMKGYRYGSAQVSTQHANFIVTESGASTDDVLRLIDLVRERVAAVHQTKLEVEVDIW